MVGGVRIVKLSSHGRSANGTHLLEEPGPFLGRFSGGHDGERPCPQMDKQGNYLSAMGMVLGVLSWRLRLVVVEWGEASEFREQWQVASGLLATGARVVQGTEVEQPSVVDPQLHVTHDGGARPNAAVAESAKMAKTMTPPPEVAARSPSFHSSLSSIGIH